MRRFRPARCRVLLSAALCAGLLAGCSSVPDAMNPVEWYRDTRDWIVGTDEPEKAKTAPKPSTADSKDFPRLSTVPPRPQPPTAAERNQLARSLAADREKARYSDEIIRRQTDSSGKMSEAGPSSMTAPKAAETVPEPASGRASPPPPSPSTAPSAPVSSAPPFPPMPAAPPAPSQTGVDVPPMPSQAAAAPPMPQTAMAAPPMPRTAPTVTAPPPPASGNVEFGPLPSDIVLDASPPATPALRPPPGGAGQQSLPAANQFSSRFPASGGSAPQAFSMAAGQSLGTIRFDVGSAELSNSARAAIGRIARTIRQSDARVRVVGHASSRTRNMDPMSHHMANFKVSLDRANAVARELRWRGVNPSSVTVEAVSDTQPIFIEVMPAGEAGNRRVEILIEN